ncbi:MULTISPECIES: plasmid replication protein RepC [Aminobacter]|jgi:replication initiation protein RepC|uniref:Replication initiation protein RepC n=1 Tax=Aminobacter ciceronei TaxID=150723 RepID=A0ABR6C990_9HYPH|nr:MULTISPECIES: plasmid replication protein RepC [Aminobacter]MBA8907661.1 replication initiation protein RepC [Aminobacter ciceronei]MBA9021489.1 replication initiation protein RepC [Aminobacter ciceronei]QOF74873.1 replication initiation protein RepC [Aminobacter sp. SR38]
MTEHISTTPFGRRSLSLAMVAGQMAADSCAPGASSNKWQVFRAVCEAKQLLGASDRALAVLNALLSFHPDTDLVEGEGLVVFPSNAQLALRAHGMAPATLRRHLSVLVDCGLVVRRDSPNGKRYARKGFDGAIEQAFGFDLTPLLARAEEFERMAEAVRAERRSLLLVRERITILRRDIAKMIAFGLEEGIAADWPRLHLSYRDIVAAIPRTASRLELEPIAAELAALAQEVRKALESHVKTEETSANESHSERHIQNSNTHPHEFEPGLEKGQGTAAAVKPETRSQPPTGYPLGMVLRACPDIADYARNGISGWADLVETANLVRGALGVSPDAWNQACEAMGAVDAAIMVAAMLQKGEAISSPGGYLRSLTAKARAGEFSIGPVLMALLRGRGGAQAKAG